MHKTNVRLRVCGMECPIISEDSEEYIISVGEEINSRVEQITEKIHNYRHSWQSF